jgi:hypothetical protein
LKRSDKRYLQIAPVRLTSSVKEGAEIMRDDKVAELNKAEAENEPIDETPADCGDGCGQSQRGCLMCGACGITGNCVLEPAV